MIISHSKKVIFIEVPKTGSSSLSKLILDSDFFTYNKDVHYGQHTKVTHAVSNNMLTSEQANTYRIYAFVRNPYDRVLSAWNHDMYTNGVLNDTEYNRHNFDLSIQHSAEFISSRILRLPQSDMYDDCNPVMLQYENYDAELKKVFAAHNVPLNSIPFRNVRRDINSSVSYSNMLSKESRMYIQHKYKKDFMAWNKVNEDNNA